MADITIHSLGPNTDGFNVAGTDMEIRDSSECDNAVWFQSKLY
jgi:hypothetical protein